MSGTRLRRTYVVATASDGYQAVLFLGRAVQHAYRARGPSWYSSAAGLRLQDGEGKIALVSLADEKTGPRHVKWLSRIDVRRVPE
mgnify:CR=1 FL=1